MDKNKNVAEANVIIHVLRFLGDIMLCHIEMMQAGLLPYPYFPGSDLINKQIEQAVREIDRLSKTDVDLTQPRKMLMTTKEIFVVHKKSLDHHEAIAKIRIRDE